MQRRRRGTGRLVAALALAALVVGGCGAAGGDAGADGSADAPADAAVGADAGDVGGWADAAEPDAGGPPDVMDGDAAAAADAGAVGLDPSLAAALQAALDDYVAFSGDPGIAFALRDGARGVAWSGTAGLADVAAGAPVTAESRFRVGSNTKPIVAAWILQLVEEGRVELDAPLTDWLPEYPQWSGITVRHLLAMQSGIPEYLGVLPVLVKLLTDPEHVWTPAEVLSHVADQPLAFPPGEGGAYSNSNWLLLGLIGEAAAGESARVELQRRFFGPLGLVDTYLEQAGDPVGQLVHGYMDLSVLVPLLKLPSAMFAVVPRELYLDGTQTIDATTLLHPSLTWTAGAIVSTPDDLARFQRALQRGELLAPATLAEMRAWHPITLLGGETEYGLGLMRQRTGTALGDLYGHGGLNFGFHVETWYAPDRDLAFCHMHNFLPAQTVAVTQQVVGTYLAEGEGARAACAVPAALFGDTPVDEPVAKLVFDGVVGETTRPAEQPAGQCDTWVTLGARWVRLYGFDRLALYASAALGANDLGTYLTFTAWGRGDGGDDSLRRLTLSVDPALLEGVGADGFRDLTAGDARRIGLALVDFELDAALQPASSCIVAVSDALRPGRLYSCEGEGTEVAPGARVRIGARVPLTTDAAVIEAFAAAVGEPVCTCYDAAGQPVACP